jgi:protein O-mannosyl-transferase
VQQRHSAWALWPVGVLLLTFVAYLPSLGNGFTNWDDPLYVLENPLVTSPALGPILTTPIGGNYHPLTILSLALNYRISGLNPASYHWLSLLLHLANTGLVFAFIWRLSAGKLWAAVVTSLFFGIHPLHVESVAWIAERKDVLYAFFYLLGLIAYLRYLGGERARWLGAALIAAILSQASKPAAVVFPLSLLAIDFYRRRPFGPRVLLEKAPFFAVALAGGLLTLHAQAATGAIQGAHSGPSFQKALLALYAILMYVVRLFAPVRLSAVYPYPDPRGGAGWEVHLASALVAILLPTIVILCRRNRAALFGLAFFMINIVLVLPFFTVGHAPMADRYTYLPYIGLFFALASGLDEPPARTPARIPLNRIVAVGALALAVICLAQTWTRCGVWRDSETLWTDVIRKYPHRVFAAYANRGHTYSEMAGRQDAALADFNEAISLDPGVAEVWVGKGIVLAGRGQNGAALACFDRALALMPDYLAALNDRGVMKMRTGDLAGAVADFSRSVELDPGSRDAYANRADAYAAMRENERSIADRRRVIALAPADPGNYLQLGEIGFALAQLERHREAIEAFDGALRLAPGGEPRLGDYHLGRSRSLWVLGERGRALDDALEARRLGVKVEPDYLRQLGG